MKNYKFFLSMLMAIVIGFGVVSCGDDDDEVSNVPDNEIIGLWECFYLEEEGEGKELGMYGYNQIYFGGGGSGTIKSLAYIMGIKTNGNTLTLNWSKEGSKINISRPSTDVWIIRAFNGNEMTLYSEDMGIVCKFKKIV